MTVGPNLVHGDSRPYLRDNLKAHNHEYRACAKRSNFEKTCEEFQVDRTWRRKM